MEYHFHVPEDDLKRLEAFELENDVTVGHRWSQLVCVNTQVIPGVSKCFYPRPCVHGKEAAMRPEMSNEIAKELQDAPLSNLSCCE